MDVHCWGKFWVPFSSEIWWETTSYKKTTCVNSVQQNITNIKWSHNVNVAFWIPKWFPHELTEWTASPVGSGGALSYYVITGGSDRKAERRAIGYRWHLKHKHFTSLNTNIVKKQNRGSQCSFPTTFSCSANTNLMLKGFPQSLHQPAPNEHNIMAA